MAIDYSRYLTGTALHDSLDAVAKSRNLRNVELVLLVEGETAYAATNGMAPTSGITEKIYRPRVGCLAKWITATLVAHACSEHRLKLEDNVAALLPGSDISIDCKQRLASVCVLDLLNHTHGIDGSSINELPYLASGLIDGQQLCSILFESPPLAPIGTYSNYGNAGVWIAAIVLEEVYKKPYAFLLQEKLFEPLGIKAFVRNESLNDVLQSSSTPYSIDRDEVRTKKLTTDVCPAIGNELRLSSRDLLRFARHHMSCESSDDVKQRFLFENIASLRSRSFQPVGWQPKLRKICLGYNDYGAGWYGHNSRVEGDSAVIRFCPSQDVAIVITADKEGSSYAVLGALFGGIQPELAKKPMPKFLSPEEWAQTDVGNYIGNYENAALSIVVDLAANKSLRVRVYSKQARSQGSSEPYVKRYLRPAADSVFFSTPPEPLVVPFVQFLDPTNAGKYRYIQNGRMLFARQG